MSASSSDGADVPVVLVGAGPIGLEVAIALQQRGVEYVHLDKGPVAATIHWFPEQMTFFSSTDRIAIGGIPIQTVGQTKCTKEEYLAYLRSVVLAYGLEVRTRVRVAGLTREADGRFTLVTESARGRGLLRADAVVLATGGTDRPRRLGIPGEDLEHVSHYFREPHRHFGRRLLVVGGRNSAVEAALRCWHAGSQVALSYRRAAFDPSHVKYWLLPELEGRIERGEITGFLETRPTAITPTHVTLALRDGTTREVEADDVLLLTGYEGDATLFESAGVALDGEDRVPRHDETTMETNVPGLYVAGTAVAGTQSSFQVFLENCHVHADRIAAALTGTAPPPAGGPDFAGRRES